MITASSVSSSPTSPQSASRKVSEADIGRTGPGTLAGRYLRSFWQPVFHSADLAAGRTRKLTVMSEEFTLYRGDDGVARLTQPRCPHRAMLLSAGSVEGDGIRCFYHGWKFGGDGRCVEQPPEPKPFCEKIALRTYPTRERFGLIFTYLGEGPAPAFPLLPSIEEDGVFSHTDSYVRASNFFNNLENAQDRSHLAYVHSQVTGTWDNYADGPAIVSETTSWGLKNTGLRPKSGKRSANYFGMPNILHSKGPRNDAGVGAREFLAWWVPIDDGRHTQFSVVVVRGMTRAQFDDYLARQLELRRGRDLNRETLTRAVLEGDITQADVDETRVHLLFLQDDIAQAGCGLIHERPPEHLGRSDVGVIAVRKMWMRELRALADGEPLTQWRYDRAFEPMSEF